MPLLNALVVAEGLGSSGSTLSSVITDLVAEAGNILTTVVGNPVLIIFLGISVLGGVIGVLRRVIKVSRA